MTNALATLPHLPRARRLRRQGARGLLAARDGGLDLARRMPLPAGARHRIAERTLWRRDLLVVPVDRLLLGGQNRASAARIAEALDDPRWPSRRVADGPHADLLRRAARGPLSDEEILASPYAGLARATIGVTGAYFSATDESGIVEVARRFVARADGTAGGEPPMPLQSGPDDPVRVAPIRRSDCLQVIDGHHRVAAAAVAGVAAVPVRARRTTVVTPLQELLEGMSWTGGEPELYQPVEAPELGSSWRTIRRCADRMDAMLGHLGRIGLPLPGTSTLDVACCYGWFVTAFAGAGCDAWGVERDPAAPRIARAAYGLDPSRILVGDAEELLAAADRTWDVVTCFSLLHHFVLGRASVDGAELLRLLDRVTGRVLYLDTGQEHEAWFAESLAGWDTGRIADFVARHTTFDEIVDLGPDTDGVGAYAGNYGRHLLAAVRHP